MYYKVDCHLVTCQEDIAALLSAMSPNRDLERHSF